MKTRDIDEERFTYILITPAKNEADSLPELIRSVVSQNVQPIVWYIVDDGSDDNTPQIIHQATLEYPWIHSLRLDRNNPYDLDHVAFVYHQGFKYALDYCIRNGIEPKYIASSDADTIYPKDYFYELTTFLDNNSEFGIVSGKIIVKDKRGNIYEDGRIHIGESYAHGTGRVWRKKTFDETNGIPIVKGWDAVSNIIALSKGWGIEILAHVECYQLRGAGEKVNSWIGVFWKGKTVYYLNSNFLNVFGGILHLVLISRQKDCMIKSLAYICGYCSSLIRRDDKIENDVVRIYMGSYKRSIKNYWLILKQILVNPLTKRRGNDIKWRVEEYHQKKF